MTFLVFGFVVGGGLIAAAGLTVIHLALRTSPRELAAIRRITATDLAEIERLTVPLAPARQDLTGEYGFVGPASHRCDLVARTPLTYVPRHLHGARWSAPVISPDEEFNVIIAAGFGTTRELVAA